MYTELKLDVKLKEDGDVGAILDYMIDNNKPKPVKLIKRLNHNLFKTERWEWMLNGASAYFDSETNSNLDDEWNLSMCFNIKNYTNEIEEFIDFIKPFVLTKEKWGTYCYEEWKKPVNIIDGEILYKDCMYYEYR